MASKQIIQERNIRYLPILQALKARRIEKRWSQRDLAQKIGTPQSHLSKIESGLTDPRLCSLIELARTLELELMLIPRSLAPAVRAIVRGSTGQGNLQTPAYAITPDDEEDDDDE